VTELKREIEENAGNRGEVEVFQTEAHSGKGIAELLAGLDRANGNVASIPDRRKRQDYLRLKGVVMARFESVLDSELKTQETLTDEKSFSAGGFLANVQKVCRKLFVNLP
jgi:hypothetical protein